MKNYRQTITSTLIASLLLFSIAIPALADNYAWTQQTGPGTGSWFSVASASTGTKLAIVSFGGYIYTSTDSGANWTERTGPGARNWASISSSDDGTKLVAGVFTGYLYNSTDSGANWTERTDPGSKIWYDLAASADGTKVIAAAYGGKLWTSADSGATWTEQAGSPTRNWFAVASSEDGTKLAAVVYSGSIYTSIDSGVNWTEQTNAGSRIWQGIAISDDGTKLAAMAQNGYVYTSTNSGVDWTVQTESGSRVWRGLDMSDDGTIIVAGVNPNGYMYSSLDSGATWTAETSTGTGGFAALALSSDGTKIVGASYGAYIYTGGPIVAPTVSTGSAATLSENAVTLGGTISATGGASATARGFNYGLTGSYGLTSSVSGTFSAESFELDVAGLTCATTYHYRAFATNSAGTSTGSDATFTTPACAIPSTPPPATLHVVTHVINDNEGSLSSDQAMIHVRLGQSEAPDSPAKGNEDPGTDFILEEEGMYTVKVGEISGYFIQYGSDCSAAGIISIAHGEEKTCSITIDDLAPGQTPPPPPPPSIEEQASSFELSGPAGVYDPLQAQLSAPTIEADKQLSVATSTHCITGTLVKLPNDGDPITQADSAVYYCGGDAKRYAFPNEPTYTSWYSDFSGVILVSPEQMALIPLGGMVTFRPGTKLVKIISDEKVYTISRGGVLRWIEAPTIAELLFGVDWGKQVEDLSPAFLNFYTFGAPVTYLDLPTTPTQ